MTDSILLLAAYANGPYNLQNADFNEDIDTFVALTYMSVACLHLNNAH
jgi:hypothetical protein